MVGKAWRQEQQLAGHVASTVGKQEEKDGGAQLTFSYLFSFRALAQGVVPFLVNSV